MKTPSCAVTFAVRYRSGKTVMRSAFCCVIAEHREELGENLSFIKIVHTRRRSRQALKIALGFDEQSEAKGLAGAPLALA